MIGVGWRTIECVVRVSGGRRKMEVLVVRSNRYIGKSCRHVSFR